MCLLKFCLILNSTVVVDLQGRQCFSVLEFVNEDRISLVARQKINQLPSRLTQQPQISSVKIMYSAASCSSLEGNLILRVF